MAQVPPGPAYLLRLLPYIVYPSAVVYAFIDLAKTLFKVPASPWFIIVATILVKPALFIANRYYRRFRNEQAAAYNGAVLPPPIQESLPSIINKLTHSMASGYPGDVMQEWAEEYGNVFQCNLLTTSLVVTLEPDHVKAMLATEFDSFEKGAIFNDQMKSLLGTGIFNADGEMWRFHRSMARPFFTRERISDFEIYERNCDLSLGHAKNRLAEGHPIDFQDLVSRFTLDSATEFLFGTNVGSLAAGIPYSPLSAKHNPALFLSHPSNIFIQGFVEGQVRSALRYSLGSEWPLGAEFWMDKVSPMRKVMDEFAEPLMNAALSRRDKRLAKGSASGIEIYDEATNLLDHLVDHTQDRSTLKDELVNLLVAGRDTTACLLTYSLYMLSEYPEVERRLRQEIFDAVGKTGSPTYDHMREMKYLRAFLNEVLRLYPPVPINMRYNKRPVILPSKVPGQKPFYVPAGTMCYYPVINIHRRTDLWGPDALTFDPERFLDVRVRTYLTRDPYIFCPFNAGPRICLGQQFAYHEASFFLVRLLQRFTGFALAPGANTAPPAAWVHATGRRAAERVHPMSHLTLYVKGGLWVTMKPLNEEKA